MTSIHTSGREDGAFLVIGCGSIGRRHISNLKKLGAERILAFDVREDRRNEIAEQFQVKVFSDLESAFDKDIRAAFICSPTSLHVEHALAAACRGCHLFIEKPLSDTNKGIDELLMEIKGKNLTALVGCNFRFHPGLRKVKELLERKSIGRVISARAQFGQYLPDWHPWEDYRMMYSARRHLGGGVVLDRIHEIDYVRWLMGEVTEVSAFIQHASSLEIETEDLAEILFRHASGVVTSLHLDYVRRVYDASCEIIGEEGILEWSFQEKRARWYRADGKRWQAYETPEYDTNQMYLDEMRHFLNCLAGMERPELPADDAARVLAIALAAKQAAREKRTVQL
jgi:predicted dehydrogenase